MKEVTLVVGVQHGLLMDPPFISIHIKSQISIIKNDH